MAIVSMNPLILLVDVTVVGFVAAGVVLGMRAPPLAASAHPRFHPQGSGLSHTGAGCYPRAAPPIHSGSPELFA